MAQSAAGYSPKRRSLVGKLSSSVAAHPSAALAIIVVLIVVVIGLLVYYRGVLFLGPYAKGGQRRRAHSKKDAGGEEQPDAETENLIATINSS